ncbi:MAG: DUF4105 domain-containing protein [Paludibacteraceae bacterium]|nr:DUF4105 domain-containing protein [Paludibacteraceae bacterium]
MRYRGLYIIVCLLAMWLQPVCGQEQDARLSPAARISLLTCTPGNELYTRYGHTAIRVYDPANRIDWVFNYGMFSFEDSNFYWHFVQGQTWYELGRQSYRSFMEEYHLTSRPVAEQILNLSPYEREQLYAALVENARPENCKYLYNFVFDNCATRPYHILRQVLNDTLQSTYTGWEGHSYREFIHHYTRHGSWAEFGINLVFGYKADRPISGEQRLFLPEELMLWLQHATRSDGTPVVAYGHVEPFKIAPVHWYADWRFGLLVFALAMAAVSVYDRRRFRRSRWVDIVLYILYGLMAALLIFLIFFSIHPLVSIGWRVFIIPAIHLCARLIYIWH